MVVSFQVLPKILGGYPHSQSTSERQRLLDWAVKDLGMMDVFFDNLKGCVDEWRTQLEDKPESMDLRSKEQQIQARLDFLTALYSNELSPDHFSKYHNHRSTHYTVTFLIHKKYNFQFQI